MVEQGVTFLIVLVSFVSLEGGSAAALLAIVTAL